MIIAGLTPDLFTNEIRNINSEKTVNNMAALVANMLAEVRQALPPAEFEKFRDEATDCLDFLGDTVAPLVTPGEEQAAEEIEAAVEVAKAVEALEEEEAVEESKPASPKAKPEHPALARARARMTKGAQAKLDGKVSIKTPQGAVLKSAPKSTSIVAQVVGPWTQTLATDIKLSDVPVGVLLDITKHEEEIANYAVGDEVSDYEKALVIAELWAKDLED